MTTYSGQTRADLMNQYDQQLQSSVHARKMYMGGTIVPMYKQQEHTDAAYSLEMSNQRIKLLQLGGLKKKTKRKHQDRKQKVRHVQVRTNTQKRRNTRKKYNKKHRR